MRKLNIAIAIPWFGEDLTGGAEMLAWQVSTRLAQRGHNIEVLTSCCYSFQSDWAENYYDEGITETNGVIVRRFKVSPRNREQFDLANALLLNISKSQLKPGVSPVDFKVANQFFTNNIHTPDLYKFLKLYSSKYDSLLFMPYLYGPILKGIPLVKEKAFLQPCLHDEVYAYLPIVRDIFHKADGILFNSHGEAELAAKLFGPYIASKGIIVGSGVEIKNLNHDLDSPLSHQYILYLGRKDETKNTPLLLDAFKIFQSRYPELDIKLVLAGPGDIVINDIELKQHVIDMGLVNLDTKEALLQNCLALVQPSQNESFSRVIMEAWFYGKPVIVHKDCLATQIAVQKSGGGFIAANPDEWADILQKISSMTEEELNDLGERGKIYAQEVADWDNVISRYEQLFYETTTVKKVPVNLHKKTIHQILPNLSYGDAISNHAIMLKNMLNSWGYRSEIFVRYIDDRMTSKGKVFNPKEINKTDALIYHHSIGSELTRFVVNHQGPKMLIYHNITPAKFFKPFRPEFANILEEGRVELKSLAAKFKYSAGVSLYNVEELKEYGFEKPQVLPIMVDPSRFNEPPDPEWMNRLQDGTKNIIFVGRLAPNKCQHHLLEAFKEFLSFEHNARLIIIGHADNNDPYAIYLRGLSKDLGIDSKVIFTGQITNSQLWACYKTAHLFWSMSEHEGFCVPLVEAMWFDVPILAFKSTAIPETLGKSAVMFKAKKSWIEIAALANLIIADNKIKDIIIKEQRKRRKDFLSKAIIPLFEEIIDMLIK